MIRLSSIALDTRKPKWRKWRAHDLKRRWCFMTILVLMKDRVAIPPQLSMFLQAMCGDCKLLNNIHYWKLKHFILYKLFNLLLKLHFYLEEDKMIWFKIWILPSWFVYYLFYGEPLYPFQLNYLQEIKFSV